MFKRDLAGVWFTLTVLFAINTMNFFDRQILGAVGEAVRKDWSLSDGALGALGTAFTLLYALIGVPLGRLTDRTQRKWMLSAGVVLWSLMTVASGLAQNFRQLFVVRLLVGVGEASCAPAATSLIGDIVPANRRSKALSIFMMGLPVGIALSFAVSGTIARSYGWRQAFFVAGLPGLLCALAVFYIREPERGATEAHAVGKLKRPGSPYRLVLATPTMRWLILSGALHNFNMYAIASFITPFLMRYHGVDIRKANFISMVVYGLTGSIGLIFGGIAGDACSKRKTNGRLTVGTLAILCSVPFLFLALAQPRGDTTGFMLLMGTACAAMYVYYSSVYATIHDVIEPSLRGTAMAVYFFAMYLLGASLGPYGTGLLSDLFTTRAARAAGVLGVSQQVLEPFRADGLHAAMYVVPVLSVLLTAVLFAASRTVVRDVEGLQSWMRSAAKAEQGAD